MKHLFHSLPALTFSVVLMCLAAPGALAQGRDVPYRDTMTVRHSPVEMQAIVPEPPDTSRWDAAAASPGVFLQFFNRDDHVDERTRLGIGIKARVPVYRFEQEGCVFVEPGISIGQSYLMYDFSAGIAPYRWAYAFVGYGWYSRTDDDINGYLDIHYRLHGAVITGIGVRSRHVFVEAKYLMYTSGWETETTSHFFNEQTTIMQEVPNSFVLNLGVLL